MLSSGFQLRRGLIARAGRPCHRRASRRSTKLSFSRPFLIIQGEPACHINENHGISRRELGKRVGQVAAVSALAGIAVPAVHAAGDSTIQIVLVGCGGRGTGAAGDA